MSEIEGLIDCLEIAIKDDLANSDVDECRNALLIAVAAQEAEIARLTAVIKQLQYQYQP